MKADNTVHIYASLETKCLVVRFFSLSLFTAVEMLLLTAYPSRIPGVTLSLLLMSMMLILVIFCCCCFLLLFLLLFLNCFCFFRCCFVCFFVSFRCLVPNVAYVHGMFIFDCFFIPRDVYNQDVTEYSVVACKTSDTC